MTESGTEEPNAGLPILIERRRLMRTVTRPVPTASGFVSQLIAERDRLPPQRQRRQAPIATAIDAYRQGERRDARRLPQGFFRSAEA